MKLHEPYEPKLRKNYMLAAAAAVFAAAAATLWFFHDKLSLNTGTLFIISGTAIFSVILTFINYKRKKENFLKAKELSEKQNDIGKDKGNEIFF
ncbi:MAG: hypothetical protein K2K57_09590 [Oscillospiraceae bacterium]|nr:hypothetical protein [Oscillospiraceae bacterium]